MNNKKTLILSLAALVVLLLVATIVYNFMTKDGKNLPPTQDNVSQDSQSQNQDTGNSASSTEKEKIQAPDFTVYDADGNEVKFSDYKGKSIVINFWASWCGPCKSEMPYFNAASKEYADKDVVFMMINQTDGKRETLDIAKKFVSDNGYSFNVFFDTKFDASNIYGVTALPSTVFIDKDGYVTFAYAGVIPEEKLKQEIETLIK